MAKPTKHAALLCTVFTVVAAVGAIIGGWAGNAFIVLLLLLPAIIYEVYRTQGESTRWAAWVLLGVAVLELVLLATGVTYDLAAFFGDTEKYVAGYAVPLGDITVVGPAVISVLSLILITRTRGVYTKWLAVVIILGCIVTVYALDSSYFSRLLRLGAEEAIENIN